MPKKPKKKILDSYNSCTGCRIEVYSAPDSRGRVHYAAFWIAHQHWFGVPPDRMNEHIPLAHEIFAVFSTQLFGPYSRYRLEKVGDISGAIRWLVFDAAITDETTGKPALIRNCATCEEATRGLEGEG